MALCAPAWLGANADALDQGSSILVPGADSNLLHAESNLLGK